MQGLPIRDMVVANQGVDYGRIEKPLKGFVVKIGEWPGETGGSCPADGIGHGGLADPTTGGYGFPALAA
jgi:hypothetical protein